jgi:hypothetical protein
MSTISLPLGVLRLALYGVMTGHKTCATCTDFPGIVEEEGAEVSISILEIPVAGAPDGPAGSTFLSLPMSSSSISSPFRLQKN